MSVAAVYEDKIYTVGGFVFLDSFNDSVAGRYVQYTGTSLQTLFYECQGAKKSVCSETAQVLCSTV